MQPRHTPIPEEDMMNYGRCPIPWVDITILFCLIYLCAPFTSWAANECGIEYKAAGQTKTKSLNAGTTFTFSPTVSGLSWVRSAKTRPVDVQVTNLTANGPNPKWMTLSPAYPRDPLSGNYSGSVKLYKVRCLSLTFPDTQNTPAPGGSVPIPYPNIGQ